MHAPASHAAVLHHQLRLTLMRGFYPHLCLDSLPSKTPLVLGEVGVRHRTRGNVLLPPIPKPRSSQQAAAAAPSGNAATPSKHQITGRTAAAAAAAAADSSGTGSARLAATAHLDTSRPDRPEPPQTGKSSSGHHPLLCVPKHMLPKSLPASTTPSSPAAAWKGAAIDHIPLASPPPHAPLVPSQPSEPPLQPHPRRCPDKAPGTAGSSPCQVLLPGTLLLHPLPLHEWQACAMTPSLIWRLEGESLHLCLYGQCP
eukprot:scaffold126022_cov17-Tisochrysis_lutea.AAC.1